VSAEGRNNRGRKSETARKMAAELKKTAIRRAENSGQRFFPQPVKPLREDLITAGLKPGPPKESKFRTRRDELED
jgi:hypothetical protein